MSAYLLYGFWLPCGPDDPPPPGVDARVWTNQSPARALEQSIAAYVPLWTGTFDIVEAWNDYQLERVYVAPGIYVHSAPTWWRDVSPGTPVPCHHGLRDLFEKFDGKEYGWHLVSSDQEDP